MPPKFVLRDSNGRDTAIGDAAIGRDAACQILLSGDPLVSRRHALVWAQGDALYVRDENSSNGTFVNGQRLTPNQPAPLRVGDKLGVGSTLFLVVAAEAPPATVIASRAAAAPAAPPATPAPVAAAVPPTASPPAAPTARRRPAWLLACGIVGALALLVVCVAGVVILSTRGTGFLAGLSGAATPAATLAGPPAGTPAQTVLGSAAPLALLTSEQYAASNQDLARAVAELNQAELDFVRLAGGAGLGRLPFLARPALRPFSAADVEAGLLNVAAKAFNTATLADRLSQTAAAQGGGSAAAGQTASHYRGIARLSAALVIEAQNARQALGQNAGAAKSAASTIAEYGARLWNPAAVNLAADNPFTSLLPSGAELATPQTLAPAAVNQLAGALGDHLTAWVAATNAVVTKTLTVPAAAGGVIVKNDAATLAQLTTAAGQADANAADQSAAAIIQPGSGVAAGQQPVSGPVIAPFWSSITVDIITHASASGAPASGALALPVYPNGSGSAVSDGPEPDDTLTTLVAIGSGSELTLGEQTPIQASQPVVNLSLSNITISKVSQRPKDNFNSFEADVEYEFDVQWTSTLVSPRFELDCTNDNHFEVTSASGTLHVHSKGLLYLFPGGADAFCYASRNGNTLGSASTRFLVGDAAGATQRAVQVSTDSASLDLTLTADANGTEQAVIRAATASQAVLGTQNALETEVAAQQTEEFAATITAIARLTALAVPAVTETPSPTPTFVPVLLEEVFHSGDMFAVSTKTVLQPGRLYQFCFSGEVNLVNPDRAVDASEIDHVNGIAVPPSGCLTIEGNGKTAVITCGQGEAAEEPGGYTIRVVDLGPI